MSTATNVIDFEDHDRAVRRTRAAFVKQLLDDDGRSVRYVAPFIGISHSALGDRLKGKAPFLADELENIARVLKMDPVRFYAAYISAGTPQSPDSEEAGRGSGADARGVRHLVFVGPAGIEPTTSTVESSRLAPVTPIFGRAS